MKKIPDSWKEYKLEDTVIKMQSGGTPKSSESKYYNGNIPFVKIEDVTGANKYIHKTSISITEEGLKNCSAWLVPENTVMYTMYASLGFVAINKIPAATNQAIMNIIPNPELININYFYHYLKDYKKNIDKFIAETTQKNLNAQKIKSFPIILPPLETQKQIAAVLDKADELRQKRKQANAKLDEFLQSVFLDMFGDPVRNPKGFKIRNLKEFYAENNGVKCGPFGSALKKEEYTETGIPVWTMDNITKIGQFVDQPFLRIPETKYKNLASYSVKNGDIIISRAGTVGKMCPVVSRYEKSIIY